MFIQQKGPVEAFNNMGPFLKVYAHYVNNYNGALDLLHQWEKRSQDFGNFKMATEFRPECQSLKLESLLITPVQRIPRYRLLLQDLLKHTKETHPDFAKLKDVCGRIDEMAEYINDHLKAQENTRKLLEIQKGLTGQSVPGLLTPGRAFIREGRLMKVCRNSNKAKERMFFLFSDMLIYARPNLGSRTYECRCVLPLLHSSVCLVLGDANGPGTLFKVSSEDTSVLVFSTNQDDVYSWLESIRKVIQDLMETVSYKNTPRAVGNARLVSTDPSTTPTTTTATPPRHLHLDSPPPNSKPDMEGDLQLSPYPLTATIISSKSEEDLVGIQRRGSESSHNSSNSDEMAKPRPKRSMKITPSPFIPSQPERQPESRHKEGGNPEVHPEEHQQQEDKETEREEEVQDTNLSTLMDNTVTSFATGRIPIQSVQSRCCSIM
jgi:hypothetical protein